MPSVLLVVGKTNNTIRVSDRKIVLNLIIKFPKIMIDAFLNFKERLYYEEEKPTKSISTQKRMMSNIVGKTIVAGSSLQASWKLSCNTRLLSGC